MTLFDHLEVHVEEIEKYIKFLIIIFEGGKFKKLTDDGICMFKSPEGIFIEIKHKKDNKKPELAGFCQPCLRKKNAKKFIKDNKLNIVSENETPNGKVYFFKDHEGIFWHLKDYQDRDWTNNW